jgi:type II secretory pathway pseudopilin PulG
MNYRFTLSVSDFHRTRVEGLALIRQPAEKGFTLIETIISVSIMMLLLGYALVGYTSYNEQQKVKQTALTLTSDLRMARTNAESGKRPTAGEGCLAGDIFGGYQVTFDASSYSIVPLCGLEGDTEVGDAKITVTLPPGITIFPIPDDPPSFIYYPLTQGISKAPGFVTLTNGSFSVNVPVDEATGPTPINTSTLTPTVTLTPTQIRTPTPVAIGCNDRCLHARDGRKGSCTAQDACTGSVEKDPYGCVDPDICCCTEEWTTCDQYCQVNHQMSGSCVLFGYYVCSRGGKVPAEYGYECAWPAYCCCSTAAASTPTLTPTQTLTPTPADCSAWCQTKDSNLVGICEGTCTSVYKIYLYCSTQMCCCMEGM